MTSPISRKPLREQVRQEIVRAISAGEWPAGSRINESDVATTLGVSRTPVREALMNLEQSGMVVGRPNNGFYVAIITPEQIEQTYPIVAALERLAVLSTGSDALTALGARLLEAASSPPRGRTAQAIDEEWHSLLVSACGNERLIDLLLSLKPSIRAFEIGYLLDSEDVRVSGEQHTRIAEAMLAERRNEAAELIAEHWLNGMRRLLERTSSRSVRD